MGSCLFSCWDFIQFEVSLVGCALYLAFATCIAVYKNPRWGRCYESYSEDYRIVKNMTEIIPGLQGDLPAKSKNGVPFVGGKTKVAAYSKRFVGDGGTVNGVGESNTVIPLKLFI